jgi:hypothetical protein
VNGCEQVAGGDGPEDPPAVEVIGVDRSSDADAVTMDLAGCYPDAAGLDALRRTLTLARSDAPSGGRVRVDDRASFADAAPDRAFASVLIAHRPTRAVDGRLVIDGDRTRTTVTPTPDATIETTHAGTLRNERDDDVLVRDLNRAVLVPDESPDGEEVRLSLRIDVEPAGEGP